MSSQNICQKGIVKPINIFGNLTPVEFGGKRGKAQPFMRPAGYDNEEACRDLVVQDVLKAISELAK